MRAYVEAYGCTLNFGEAREIEDMLVSRGWEISETPEGSDLTVVATCVVIETTERAMLKRLRELASSPRLIVTGCMATACREKAERVAPGAEFVAPGDIESLSAIAGPNLEEGHGSRVRRGAIGIVPIATGCRGECAYCITRLARGGLKSRAQERVLNSVERLVKSGPKEIQLTAQDSAAYGSDIGTDLPSLVHRVCAIPHDFRLRVGMMNPRSALPLTERLGDMFEDVKVFKFLHLPVQSASDELLRDMDRGYDSADFRAIVSGLRRRIPGLTLSTDLIVGYPGETIAHHRMNLEMISELRPDIVNVTRFSARPGTKAASAGGKVVGWMAKDRSREITRRRFEVSLERNRECVGMTTTALATEAGREGSTILRTDEYRQVVVPGSLPLGRFYEVEITGATRTYLKGVSGGAR
jgi:MiaB-like tRNA modifying enzyme